jgi:predicted PurR-regulated permease PerM
VLAVGIGMTLRFAVTSTLLVLAIALVVFALDLVLLLFAASLIAVVLRGTAYRLSQRSGWPVGASLATVVALLIGGLALGGAYVVPALGDQMGQLRSRIPEAVARVQEFVNQFGWVETLVDATNATQATDGPLELGRPGVVGRITTVLSSTLGGAINLAIVLVVALYLAVNPTPYVDGIVRLFPRSQRDRACEVMHALGDTLFAWLHGQLVAMALVGVLVTTGLWLLGVPLAVMLGLIAAMAEFMPNIGPILAAVPAALLALTVSPAHVAYVIVLFIAIQVLESYALTPYVMHRVVALPPALTIVAQLVGALMAGWVGLLLATPLVAALLVLVRMVYLEGVLGEPKSE